MISLLPLLVLAITPAVPAMPAAFALQSAQQTPHASETTQQDPARIQWFGTLEQGLAEAKRTNRPLLMTAAAPACGGIAGMW